MAIEASGVATTGTVSLEPGIPTAVPATAEVVVDMRHPDADALRGMREATDAEARFAAEQRGCGWRASRVWSIDPTAFDPGLVALAKDACREVAGSERALVSGALHDAAEAARVVPAAMIVCSSVRGISHNPAEDTPEEDLRTGIEAFGALAATALEEE